MNLFRQPCVEKQWIYTPNPKLDTYYVVGTSPVWRLIWVNRMGRVYRYDFQEKEFVRDDIVENLEKEWYLYAQIILKETSNLNEAKKMASIDDSRYEKKQTLEFLLLPYSIFASTLNLFVFLPIKFKLRRIKRIFLK